MQVIRHILVILAALFVLLGLPAMYFTQGTTGETDSVSGASQAVPERPSGEFVVLMSKERHPDSLDAWTDFFSERPTDVIMEDLSCMTVQDDAAGLQLARRYQSRLAENQMTVRQENPVLVASRAENGLFDAIILSKEAADAYQFSDLYHDSAISVISVKGAPQ